MHGLLKWGGRVAVLTAGLAGFAGCNDSKTELPALTVSDGTAPRVRLVGNVVDAQSHEPLSARVSVCGFGNASTDAAGNFVLDISGAIFSQLGFDDGNPANLRIKIESSGRATFETTIQVHNDQDQGEFLNNNDDGNQDQTTAPNTHNLNLVEVGTVHMITGQPLTVVVTKDGEPLGNARVFAVLNGTSGFASSSELDGTTEFICTNQILGTTAAAPSTTSGTATLQNLDPRFTYLVAVPAQDLNGDGVVDFSTATTTFTQGGTSVGNPNAIGTGNVVAINVVGLHSTQGVLFDDIIATNGLAAVRRNPVGSVSNARQFHFLSGPIASTTSAGPGSDDWTDSDLLNGQGPHEEVLFTNAVNTADGTVRIVFRVPVTILDGAGLAPTFEFANNLVDPRTSSFTLPTNPTFVTGTARALPNSANTIWDIVPNTAIPTNEVIRDVAFFIRSLSDDRNVARLTTGALYHSKPGNSSLAVNLDNYNGSQDASGGALEVFLEFDEVVSGTYSVLEIRSGTTVSPQRNPFQHTIESDDFSATTAGSFTGNGDVSMVFNADLAPSTGVASGASSPNLAAPWAATASRDVRFRVRLRDNSSATGGVISLNDSTTPTPTAVTILLSVEDVDGVRRDETVTLSVK